MAAISDSSSERVKVPQRTSDGGVRKRYRIPGDKFCAVCGDKALAHHFAVLACESCKAFFRRNASRQKDLKPCTGKKCCLINKDNRRFCPSCRLTKCFDMGMKADLIYDEEQKKNLMEKVKKSKQGRLSQPPSLPTERAEELSPLVSSIGGSVTSPDMTPTPEAEAGHGHCPQKWVDNGPSDNHFVINTETADKFPQNARNNGAVVLHGSSEQRMVASEELYSMESGSQHLCMAGIQKGIEDVSMDGGESSVLCQPRRSFRDDQSLSCSNQSAFWMGQMKPLTTDLGTLMRDDLPSDPHMYRRLSQEERALLNHLSFVYEDTMLAYLRERRNAMKLDSSNYSVGDCLADYETMVRNATDFTKQVEDFQRLDFDDKISTFKSSVDTLIAVYNTYVFVAERDSWLMLKGEVSLELFMIIFPGYPVLGWRRDQCRGLKSLAKNDVTIYSLIHCILLFNPSSEKVSNRQLVSNLREKYMILLRHYVEATFSYVCSERYFKELQNRVVEIQDICQADRKHAEDTNCHLTDDFVSFDLLLELHREDNDK